MPAKVKEYKKREVTNIETLLKGNSVIGFVDISGIAGPQMQSMKKGLAGKATMKVAKNRLMSLAIRKVYKDNPKMNDLLGLMKGETAIIATDMNPFRLNKIIEGTRTRAPARGGETAPDDISVSEGPTDFPPGPIVGDLQKVGIPAGIVDGKVVVKKAKTVVKQGEVISRELAGMLTRLNILPLIVGLNLKAVYEAGMIYKPDVLHIDDVQVMGNFMKGSNSAFNLAMFAAIPTKTTIEPLMSKGHMEAMNLAMEAGVVNKETIKMMLAKGNMQMMVLKAKTEAK